MILKIAIQILIVLKLKLDAALWIQDRIAIGQGQVDRPNLRQGIEHARVANRGRAAGRTARSQEYKE